MVFISHRIHELMAICDRLTVLRDGERVGSGAMQGLSAEQIIEQMIGHRLGDLYPPRRAPFSTENCCMLPGCMMRNCFRILT